MLLSTAYMPCIEYMAYIAQSDCVTIEAHEHYIKQSYRNRAYIATANGIMELIIPVIQPKGSKTNIRDVQISYAEAWQKKHWHAIVSAYNSSPYFEYYQDLFHVFYTKHYLFLWDFNRVILEQILKLCSIDTDIQDSHIFTPIHTIKNDKRNLISPKIESNLNIPEYKQVFSEKYGFISSVSILDTLCNLGPDTSKYCLQLKLD